MVAGPKKRLVGREFSVTQSRHECSCEKWKHFSARISAAIYFKKSFQNCALIFISGRQAWKDFLFNKCAETVSKTKCARN